jgi:RNA polymerase sigma-70 factor (ECF subfamily)
MRADDDGALLTAAPRDVTAFESLYRRYVGQVTAYAVARCSTAADVGDVVAQTFVRLLHVADRYDPTRGTPGAFVFAVAGNVLRDHYRSAQREQALVHRMAGRDLLVPDEIERVEAAIDAARAAAAAEAAVDSVTDHEAEILRLVADGASPSQAAAVLGITPVAARGRLFRARRRVQSQLASITEET